MTTSLPRLNSVDHKTKQKYLNVRKGFVDKGGEINRLGREISKLRKQE